MHGHKQEPLVEGTSDAVKRLVLAERETDERMGLLEKEVVHPHLQLLVEQSERTEAGQDFPTERILHALQEIRRILQTIPRVRWGSLRVCVHNMLKATERMRANDQLDPEGLLKAMKASRWGLCGTLESKRPGYDANRESAKDLALKGAMKSREQIKTQFATDKAGS